MRQVAQNVSEAAINGVVCRSWSIRCFVPYAERGLSQQSSNATVHGNVSCHNTDHIALIEKYYCDIVNSIAVADSILPSNSPTIQRDYWNEELSSLKSASIDAFNIWKNAGRPSSGMLFDLKKTAHYRYKLLVRKSQRHFDQNRNDDLHNHLLEKNSTGFWKSWKSVHGSGQISSTRIKH